MSLRQVEQDTGVSCSSIHHWEQGGAHPKVLRLHALACCFVVTMDSFFEGVTFEDEDAT
jgi:transcriptional regulator with XRE-family HTH domain